MDASQVPLPKLKNSGSDTILSAYGYNYTIHANGSAACAKAVPGSAMSSTTSVARASALLKHSFAPTVVPLYYNDSLPVPANMVTLVAAVQNTSCIGLSGMLKGGAPSQDIILGLQQDSGLVSLTNADPPSGGIPVDFACAIDGLAGGSQGESCFAAGQQYPNASVDSSKRYWVFVANKGPDQPIKISACNTGDHYTSDYTLSLAPKPSPPPPVPASPAAAARTAPPSSPTRDIHPSGPVFGNAVQWEVTKAVAGVFANP
ncbi:hypothetical protein WJX72_009488 [[Myrmecia] bisecta]|uniref:Malate dehydrogenase n=1 Tax=[Myrmecia] bisecta TaxID=41462 RepID=A0AAW1PKI0_9CHLO